MKVIFKHSKVLGTAAKGEEREMFDSTAAILERKGFGKIIKKIVSVKKKGDGFAVEKADLTKEDREKLQLDNSLVKTTK